MSECSVCGLVWGGECPTFACSEVKRLRSELDDARASEAELRGLLAASREQVQAMRCERDEWRNEWQGAYENASRWKRERDAYRNGNRDLHDENQRLRRAAERILVLEDDEAGEHKENA